MDYITRYLVLTNLVGDVHTFVLREISDATHPCAEGPERQHRRFAHDIGIFVQDVLGFSKEDEEVHRLVCHKKTVGPDVTCTKVAGHRCRSVHENAIAAVAEEEWHRLIHSVGLRSLRVGNRQVYLLSHLVKFRETLATSVDAFSWSKCEYWVYAS